MIFPAAEEVTPHVTPHVTPQDGLVDSQKMILELVKEKPAITKKEMAAKIGIGSTAIDKNILKLKEMKILERVGSDRKGHWKIIPKNKGG